MDLGLGGRGYLLTGASRGLVFATARALVDDGARVLVSSRSADGVASAVEQLGGAPGAFGSAADLADPNTADRLVGETREKLGRVDGALVSVGGPTPGRRDGAVPPRGQGDGAVSRHGTQAALIRRRSRAASAARTA